MYAPAVASTQARRAGRKALPTRGFPGPTTPQLDRGLGNQATLRLLTKPLTVGAVDDPLEHEADRVADQVMRMPDPHGPVQSAAPQVSRKCAECGADEELQTKSAGPAGTTATSKGATRTAPRIVQDVVGSPGEALPEAARRFMEPRFGADFSRVRLHTGAQAAESAQAIGALAYTLGNDVVFGAGQFAPASAAGRGLLAHELTHVLQHGDGQIRRRDMAFDPALSAQQLRDAMKGLGTDEDRIYATMSGRTQAQLDQIAAAYLTLTGHELMKDLTDELSTKELTKLGALAPLAGKDDPARRADGVAAQLNKAMAGLGTDETAIFAALEGRSPDELAAIKTAYKTLTKKELLDDLRSELSGHDLEQALGEMGIPPSVYVKNTELGGLSVGNFDFHFKDCIATAWVWLKFNFSDDITAAEQAAFKTRFINAVEAVWGNSGYALTGGAACPCPSVPIRVHLQENAGGFAHKRVDVERKTDQQRRPKVISDINVNFDTDDHTFAHEFGHVLGLYDEYDGGFWENIMFWHKNVPNDPNALMSGGTELRPRYFDQYRKEIQKTAPHGCAYSVTAPPPTP